MIVKRIGGAVFRRPLKSRSLADPYLKITRAEVHLNALRDERKSFLESNPYSFIGEDDIEHGLYRLRIDIQDTPARIALIIGDLFYCLRAALDQLVWALAYKPGQYHRHTQFPIFETWNGETQGKFRRYTRGVPADALERIDKLQPHHRAHPKSTLLWLLNEMCNLDKHRRIPVHGSVTEFTFQQLSPYSARHITFEDDCVVIPARFKSQMRLDPNVTFDITFGDASQGIVCDIERIEGLGGHLKTGHTRTLQNRPRELNQNKSIYTLRKLAWASIFADQRAGFILTSPGRRIRQRRDATRAPT